MDHGVYRGFATRATPPMSHTPLKRVECTDCPFSRVVDDEDDELPAEVLIEHGRETGHTLTVSPADGSETRLSP